MGGGRKKRLSPEDAALWDRVAGTAKPLKKREPKPEPEPEPQRSAAPHPPKPRVRAAPHRKSATLKPVGMGGALGISYDLAARGVSPAPRGPVGGIDRRTAERIRKGTKSPDARIDLHGMTAERAHGALTRFVLQGAASGARLLLVITGKGGDKTIRPAWDDADFMPRREGVLKREVPRWLREAPLAPHVVGVFQAHAKHGGAGALYVYLKRAR